MRQKIVMLCSLFAFIGSVWAACPPPSQYGPSCESAGWPYGRTTSGSMTWSCCNQNFVCGSPNPGYKFYKNTNYVTNGSGGYCYVEGDIVNTYPTPALCCGVQDPG
jgi:hypothetical protein